jgi:hypothetical protein
MLHKKFQIGNNISEKLQNSMRGDKINTDIIKFHKIL